MRVLLVPDNSYWVTGQIARQIQRHNRQLDATICSEPVLKSLLRQFGRFPAGIDLVHFLTPDIAANQARKFASSTPVVSTLHHMEPDQDMSFVDHSDAVMVISSPWHRHLERLGVPEIKLRRLEIGVDTDMFRPSDDEERARIRRQLGISESAFVVGFSAKRSSDTFGRKGVDVFLAALTRLREEVPSLVGMIIGPGWKEVIRGLADSGIPCVQVPFALEMEAVAASHRAVDSFWVTSRIEGGPAPLFEAMATGVACVTTRVGAVEDVVEHGQNAMVVPFDDPDAFVSITHAFATDVKLRRRLGDAARETILAKLQWRQTMPAAGELYAAAVANFAARHSGDREPPRGSDEVLSPKLRRWMDAREQLLLARRLMDMGEGSAALQAGRRALGAGRLDLPLMWDAARIATRGISRRARGAS